MNAVEQGRPTAAPLVGADIAARPVLLLTFDVIYADTAVEFAFETAAETHSELLVVDIVPAMRVPSVGNVRSFGDPYVVSTQIEIVRRAAAQGLQVKRIVFSHPRPFHAAFEVLRDQKIGLLVFGPDRKRYGRFRFRRHAAKFRRDAPCLVWPYE
jgi:Universal stress protein family